MDKQRRLKSWLKFLERLLNKYKYTMSKYKCVKVPIKGMHCRSCEILIEDKLKEINHVKSVDIDYKTGEALVNYDGEEAPLSAIHSAITDTGYHIGSDGKLPWFSRDKKEYTNLGLAIIFIIISYFILQALGLTNLSLDSNLDSPSWGLIILVGLVAGFSTCMALIGGLSLGLSTKFATSHPRASVKEKFVPHLFFTLGRILSYAFLGGLLGYIGAVFQLSSLTNGIITIILGIVMLFMGLQLINIFPRLNKIKITLPKGLSRSLGIDTKSKEYTHWQAIILGAFTFFLPCGFTQTMQLYAISTGEFGFGALVMGLFALGTTPGLLSVGGLTAVLSGNFKDKFFKIAGVAVIFFAIFNLTKSYSLVSMSLGALNSNSHKQEASTYDSNVVLENGVQVVRMIESNKGYSPNSFLVKKDVPVKWIVDARSTYSCASVLLVPKLKIQKFLEAGENIIEFTPTEVGKLQFTCSMGMYTGVFNVYEDEK